MARPKKLCADYFSHDNDMRNDRKIKAMRSKFNLMGYGIWCMLLEVLTSAENNEIFDNELEIELLAGDFGVSVTEINDIVNYCTKIKLLNRENGVIYSQSLKERLAPVYAKRVRSEKNYRQKSEDIGVLDVRNNTNDEVSATETTQSKVKESKVNNNTVSIDIDTMSKSQEGSKTPQIENINYKELVSYFNKETKGVFGELRYPISDTRKGMINARIREHGKQSFIDMVQAAINSDFLKGDNKRGFKATFDWMIKPSNYQKIIEGNYGNRNISRSEDDYEVLARNVAEGIARANLDKQQRS